VRHFNGLVYYNFVAYSLWIRYYFRYEAIEMTTTTFSSLRNWMTLATAAMLGSGCLSPEEQCMKLGGGYNGADIAAIEAECLAEGGTNCDSEEYLEVEAAECLAREADLREGEHGYQTEIFFYRRYMLVLWNITETETTNHTLTINATTGEMVDYSIP
jgi:hypothetical protein